MGTPQCGCECGANHVVVAVALPVVYANWTARCLLRCRMSVLYSNVFNSVFVLINECLSIHNLSISPMHNEIIIL